MLFFFCGARDENTGTYVQRHLAGKMAALSCIFLAQSSETIINTRCLRFQGSWLAWGYRVGQKGGWRQKVQHVLKTDGYIFPALSHASADLTDLMDYSFQQFDWRSQDYKCGEALKGDCLPHLNRFRKPSGQDTSPLVGRVTLNL